MRFKTCIVPTLAFCPLIAMADEKIPVLHAGGVTYSNITITTVSATDVYFTYAGGMGNVKLKNLSPDLQQHFHFDAKKADEVELLQATNKLKYHEQLLHQPKVQAPDMTREAAAAAPAAAQQPVWLRNLNGILNQAQAENKSVLLDFTGSDWCLAGVKFDQDVLGTEKFASYATQKLKFVKVDFLHYTQQPDDLKQANDALAHYFRIEGFPTYVLLSSSGKELGRQNGYLEGGPDAFIKELEGFHNK